MSKATAEPSAQEAEQPNARQAGIRLQRLKAAKPQNIAHEYEETADHNYSDGKCIWCTGSDCRAAG